MNLPDGTPLRIGLLVYHQSDPRHIGRIEKIWWDSSRADIRWINTGWLTQCEKISELVAHHEEEDDTFQSLGQIVGHWIDCRQATKRRED